MWNVQRKTNLLKPATALTDSPKTIGSFHKKKMFHTHTRDEFAASWGHSDGSWSVPAAC